MNLILDLPDDLLRRVEECRWQIRANSRRTCILTLLAEALDARKIVASNGAMATPEASQ